MLVNDGEQASIIETQQVTTSWPKQLGFDLDMYSKL